MKPDIARTWTTQHLMVGILTGTVIVGFAFPFLKAVLQLLVHSAFYALDESYRIHTAPFGGYSGYLQTQLIPRIGHALVAGWYTKVFFGALAGILIVGLTTLCKASALRGLVFTIVFVLWIGWHEARGIVRNPFWAVIDIILWLTCFGLLMYVLNRWNTSFQQESNDHV